ncbi:MAG: hypothetical protein WCB68_12775 [Pyrinomonadaceae bacterium]
MANVTVEFDNYYIHYYSSNTYNLQAAINCGKGTTGGAAMIYFHKEGVSIPTNTLSGNMPVLNFPASLFGEIMAILLHEKPLKISLDSATGFGEIKTGSEPIGEEEP